MEKISINRVYYFLLIILPLMDSLNGYMNNGGNDGGLSIGIVYRIIIIFCVVYLWIKNGIKKRQVGILLSIMIVIVISAIIGNGNFFAYINRIFRLILPIVMVMSYESMNKNYDGFCYKVFEYWSILFPLTIAVPYLLGWGFNTYGSGAVGYKGFYYAQNDIGYILAILYMFMMFEISDKFSINKLVRSLVLLAANIMLGLKSNYILMVVLTIGYIFIQSKKHKTQLSKIFVVAVIALGSMAIFRVYSDEINQIITRWDYFYKNRDLLSFITSARSDRIKPAISWLYSHLGIIGLIFGSGLEYTFHTMTVNNNIIEMDFFDLFFQMGLIGVVLIYGYYFSIFKRYKFRRFYFWAFLLSIAIGFFAGHVLESALSGMFFALICSGGIKEEN